MKETREKELGEGRKCYRTPRYSQGGEGVVLLFPPVVVGAGASLDASDSRSGPKLLPGMVPLVTGYVL